MGVMLGGEKLCDGGGFQHTAESGVKRGARRGRPARSREQVAFHGDGRTDLVSLGCNATSMSVAARRDLALDWGLDRDVVAGKSTVWHSTLQCPTVVLRTRFLLDPRAEADGPYKNVASRSSRESPGLGWLGFGW
jgi:hypothetical protein